MCRFMSTLSLMLNCLHGEKERSVGACVVDYTVRIPVLAYSFSAVHNCLIYISTYAPEVIPIYSWLLITIFAHMHVEMGQRKRKGNMSGYTRFFEYNGML